jgi:hypothetical protein
MKYYVIICLASIVLFIAGLETTVANVFKLDERSIINCLIDKPAWCTRTDTQRCEPILEDNCFVACSCVDIPYQPNGNKVLF